MCVFFTSRSLNSIFQCDLALRCCCVCRCGENHSGPKGLWSFGVIRSGSWRVLHRGGQGSRSPSRLWCGHRGWREGTFVQNQVTLLSACSSQPTPSPLPCLCRLYFNLQGRCKFRSRQTGVRGGAVRGRPAFLWKPGSSPFQQRETAAHDFKCTLTRTSASNAPPPTHFSAPRKSPDLCLSRNWRNNWTSANAYIFQWRF